jgi:hypothetical protein
MATGAWQPVPEDTSAWKPVEEKPAAAPAPQSRLQNIIGGAEEVGGRALGSLVSPILHPIDTLTGMVKTAALSPYDENNPINQRVGEFVREPNRAKAYEDVAGDALGMAAQGGILKGLPGLEEPMKATGGKLIDNTVGLRKADVSHGAQPGRAYLEGGGGPALSMRSLGNKANAIAGETGAKLGDLYDNSQARIPAGNVFDAVAKPVQQLRDLQSGPGGTGVSPNLNIFEDNMLKPIAEAEGRGGFTPRELFDQVKRPISQSTRWNDPTMFDLNKVRQQTTGAIGGLLTDAVPETESLNKIFQGAKRLGDRATERADTGQSPLTGIGRHIAGATIGTGLGLATHSPALGLLPLLADTVPARTAAASALFAGGEVLPPAARGLRPLVPSASVSGVSAGVSPKRKPKSDADTN